MATYSADEVRRYYDDNTRSFLALGHGGSIGAIHRAVWGPGVTHREQALSYVDQAIVEQVRDLRGKAKTPHLVDLGAGVCGSLCRIAKQLPITGTGITLSPVQVDLAKSFIEKRGLRERVDCLQGDYCALPESLQTADVAFAIESFVHGTDSARFFEQCARLVRPGGLLILCDDFLARDDLRDNAHASRWLKRFQHGWHVNTLISELEVKRLASAAGFRPGPTRDFSPFLELGRPRDIAIAALIRCFGWLPWKSTYFRMLYGGHALQLSLKRGWIKYLMLVLERA